MQVPCYVINLADAAERRSAMAAMLRQQGIAFQFFDAIDGRAMTPAQRGRHIDAERLRREYGRLSGAEVGCALSHIGVYRDIAARRLPWAVVLEDDVQVSDDFAALLATTGPDSLAARADPALPTVIQLTHVRRHFRYGGLRLAGGRRIVRPHGGVWLAGAYFLTGEAARRLAAGLYPLWTVADHWRLIEQHQLVRLRNLVPCCAWPSALSRESSIEPGRQPRLKLPQHTPRLAQRLAHGLLLRPLLVSKARAPR